MPEMDMPRAALRWGRFEFRPAQRELRSDGVPVDLGGRAMDVLMVLVDRRERVVTRGELLDLVWPGLVVEENNLTVQVGALRKALGRETIATVPGRGYQFVAATDAPRAAPPAHTGGAERDAQLLGRQADLESVGALLARAPLVSIVGAGGVGKTALAQAVVSATASAVHWVELAPLGSGDAMVLRIAQALGIDASGEAGARQALLDSLARTSALVVLDNCEHLLGEVRALLEEGLLRAPGVRWLATSQQPLRARGEQVYRLDSLAVPPAGTALAQARECAAIALLERRAGAANHRFSLDADNIEVAIDLCARLDGLPLAIEMAAARVATLGLRAVHERFGARLMGLAGVDSAPSRQRTLRAALAWSHAMLTEAERTAFCSLATFCGGFSLAHGERVIAAMLPAGTEVEALDVLASLVDKSLVQAGQGDPPRYRLLESAREFAMAELRASGRWDEAHLHHARVFADSVDDAEADFSHAPETRFHALHSIEWDNVRAALAEAMRRGDAGLAAQLAAFAGLIGSSLGAVDEQQDLPALLGLIEEAPADARARAWQWMAWWLYMLGESAEALSLGRRALDHYDRQGDPQGQRLSLVAVVRAIQRLSIRDSRAAEAQARLRALQVRGVPPNTALYVRMALAERMEDGPDAVAELKSVLADARQAGAWTVASICLVNLSNQFLVEGNDAAVLQALGEMTSIDAFTPARPRAVAHGNCAGALFRLGRHHEARQHARSALRLLPREKVIHFVLFHLALGAVREGRLADAAAMQAYGCRVVREWDAPLEGAEQRAADEVDARVRAELSPEALARIQAQAEASTFEDMLRLGL